jgi:hypothetical protein
MFVYNKQHQNISYEEIGGMNSMRRETNEKEEEKEEEDKRNAIERERVKT